MLFCQKDVSFIFCSILTDLKLFNLCKQIHYAIIFDTIKSVTDIIFIFIAILYYIHSTF